MRLKRQFPLQVRRQRVVPLQHFVFVVRYLPDEREALRQGLPVAVVCTMPLEFHGSLVDLVESFDARVNLVLHLERRFGLLDGEARMLLQRQLLDLIVAAVDHVLRKHLRQRRRRPHLVLELGHRRLRQQLIHLLVMHLLRVQVVLLDVLQLRVDGMTAVELPVRRNHFRYERRMTPFVLVNNSRRFHHHGFVFEIVWVNVAGRRAGARLDGLVPSVIAAVLNMLELVNGNMRKGRCRRR